MNLLHAYFSSQLVDAGFPDDLDIHWSLGYCQGDGMAFYGRISFTEMIELVRKIYVHDKRKQRMLVRLIQAIQEWDYDETFEIYRNQFGYHYSHFNTMTLSITTSANLRFFDESQGKADWYFPLAKKHRYMSLWDDFIQDLDDYIRDISRRLEREGYGIIEATPYEERIAYQFETVNYRIELVAKPVDFGYFFPYEDEDMTQLCQGFIDGRSQCAELCAVVRDRRTNIALGESDWINLVFDAGDDRFAGYKSELISEAIAHAKHNIQQYSQTFAQIKPIVA